MGLFSRKKPQPLPPLPRFPAPSPLGGQQPQGPPLPSYEPEFSQQEEQKLPTFPDVQPVRIEASPEPPRMPRPADERFVIPRPPEESLPFKQEEQPVRFQQPVQRRADEIPIREPAFLRRQSYPEREAVANEQRLPFQRLEQPKQPSIPDRPLQRPSFMPPPRVQMPVSSSSQQPGMMTVEDKPLFVKIGQYREAMSNLELLKQKVKEAEAVLIHLEDLRAKEQTEIGNAHTLLANVKEKLLAIDKRLFEV